ncbi:hypothetical protein ACFLSA_03205 [Bacteroidota bacterium]
MNSGFTKEDLINYRFKQADNLIDEIQLLIKNKLYKTAVNRMYYGMFYTILVLALQNDYLCKKKIEMKALEFKSKIVKNKISIPSKILS